MTTIIPDGVLFDCILPRLPTKSVSRFKCASKEWYSFLSSNVFIKMHFRYIDHHQNHSQFIVLPDDSTEPRMLCTIDCEAPADNFITPTSFKLPSMASKGQVKFLASIHGLVVCLCIHKHNHNVVAIYDLILWNPLTSEYKILSKPISFRKRNNIFFGSTLGLFYSSCEDDYKLAILSQSCDIIYIYIYSLKADTWRRVPVQGTDGLKVNTALQGICLNENLYFLDSDKKYSVIKFDTKTESFIEMKTTSGFNYIENRFSATLMVKKGCIHVCIVHYLGKTSFETEFWKITEEGDWKKMETYHVDPGNMSSMKPLHMRSNGNLLMLGYNHDGSTYDCNFFLYDYKGFLYDVDLKKKHSEGKGKDNETLCRNMRISEIVRYSETFVSPNQYIGVA